MIMVTLIGAFFLMHFSPYEDKLVEKLDIMNDFFTIILIDFCYVFTDLLPDPVIQYKIGFAFAASMFTCIFIHLFFLVKDIFSTVRFSCKRWFM